MVSGRNLQNEQAPKTMANNIFHFRAERPADDLVLSANHRVNGKLARLLTNFQLDGIRFLYKNFGSNEACILNDESGLGKTALVGAFLSAILPANNSKRCLVIVRNNDRAMNWHFHLNALTKLRVKLVNEENDIDTTNNVFLITWDVIRKSPNIAKSVFNCVILDDRDDFTVTKVCLNFFLRHFENRISLIVSSSDVTLDIKQLHCLLRLCGRLEQKYLKLKVFEEKFSLPKPEGNLAEDRAVLEAYFQRREKIINYCRDFRLRRYRHQFEDMLPLANPTAYTASLQEWQTTTLSKSASSLSSGSVKIISSSSEKSTEELFQTYFDIKAEKSLNEEVCNINKSATNNEMGKDKQISVDTEDMSPLLFESDTEDVPIIAPNILDVEARKEIQRPRALRSRDVTSTTADLKKMKREKSKTPDPSRVTPTQQKRKGRSKAPKDEQPKLGLRSADRRTRNSNPTSTSRNAILEVFRMVEQAEAQQKRSRKGRRTITKEEPDETYLHVSSDSECEVEETERGEHQPDPDTTRTPDPIIVQEITPETNYSFNIDLLSKTLIPNSSEVQIYSPPDQIVVLTSSTECSEDALPRHSGKQIPRRVTNSGKISPSPDIFENYDEYDFFCSQRGKTSIAGARILSHSRKMSEKRSTPSCLDRLESDFLEDNDNRSSECALTDLFTDMVRIPSKNIEKRKWNVYPSANKITKYLSSQSLESTQSVRPDSTSKDVDNGLKTPQRRRSLMFQKGSPALGKKSPKTQAQTPGTTPNNGLTNWLIKRAPSNTSHADGTNKNSKRKRLDLFFAD